MGFLSLASMYAKFGSDAGDAILLFLQIRTLCRMQIVSRTFAAKAKTHSKAQIMYYAYSEDSLESSVYSRGRRRIPRPGESERRLMSFLTQPDLQPVFRELHLARAPVSVLENESVQHSISRMARLSCMVYPATGWSDRFSRQAF